MRLRAMVVTAMGLTGMALGASPGITDSNIVLGQTAVFEGPASALGVGMRAGLLACFNRVNDSGGIAGRTITLVTRDDGYEPDKAIATARELIGKEHVFLLIGGVGTPTAKVVTPLCEEAQVPFVAPFSGAALLRAPYRKYVVNLRASYGQETERLARYLADEKKLTRIACFHQNDDYGQAGLKGIETALQRRSLALVSVGNYERNTLAVKSALLDIRRGEPEAVVMVGTYKACAEFIKLAKRLGMEKTLFCNISFVGTRALLGELGDAGEGVIVSQVVPAPQSEDVPVVKEYAAALESTSRTRSWTGCRWRVTWRRSFSVKSRRRPARI